MFSRLRWIGWPLAALHTAMKVWSRRMFEAGIWKSVAFEKPVIFVGTLGNDPTLALSGLIRHSLEGGLQVDAKKIKEASTDEEMDLLPDYFTLIDEKHQVFSTSHTVLGLSEFCHFFPQTPAIVMDGQFAKCEIRPLLRVLVTDGQRPFYQEAGWPVGSRRLPVAWAQWADVVLVYNVPVSTEAVRIRKELGDFIQDETAIFFVKNTRETLNSFNSWDKIEFIQDRDNFVRLFSNLRQKGPSDSE